MKKDISYIIYGKLFAGVLLGILSWATVFVTSVDSRAAEPMDSVMTIDVGSEMPSANVMGKKAKKEAINKIIASYSNWSSVSYNGKLRSSMLPVSASLKVYMEKDKLAIISVRAPLIGEAFRLEMDNNGVLIVNKIKKRYCILTTEEVAKVYKGALTDFQNMLLGRVTLMGSGALGKSNSDKVQIFEDGTDIWGIVPTQENQPEGFVYAYAYNNVMDCLRQFVLYSNDSDNLLEIDYTEKGKGNSAEQTLDLTARFKNRVFDASLQLGKPQWGAKPMDRYEIDSKYSKCSIREIM